MNESGYTMPLSGGDFAKRIGQVPVLLVPAYRPRYPTDSTFGQATMWGSILPAVWSFTLALRSRGLGSVWTTAHLHREREMAELLGIPEGYVQAGLFPVAYTIGTDFRPGDRSFSESRMSWNRWPANEALERGQANPDNVRLEEEQRY